MPGDTSFLLLVAYWTLQRIRLVSSSYVKCIKMQLTLALGNYLPPSTQALQILEKGPAKDV